MHEIRLSEAAKIDLVDIWIATSKKWGAKQADTYLDEIDRALNGLAKNPKMGTDCSDVLHQARRLVMGRHLGFYEISEGAVFVIRVLHQSMDVAHHLRDV
ncbi:type II toxin-antitoxin system RelE/ParE family toxin [Sedimentitalea sp.]|uniref:type II toxin-antitoxin system RelE/ParE family toxin n=1 Tax=Sedimentitalea sp. TaxID=2048915 RepID=UPI00329A559D